jgi:riboflavin synthase
MFTGIVEEVGVVKSLTTGRLTITARRLCQEIKPGDSVSVNGACLTAFAVNSTEFSVEVMLETLRRTNLGRLMSGSEVNLEMALAADGRFGGHFVQGHIDSTGTIVSIEREGAALLLRITAPTAVLRYTVEKGFIAVDGVSLTIIGYDASSFSVSIVGYTRDNTILVRRKIGDVVNLEVDIMSKYIEKLGKGVGAGITADLLREYGFFGT